MDSNRRRVALLVAVAIAIASMTAMTAAAATAKPTPTKPPADIGPDAVWKPPADFRDRVNAACGNAGKKFSDCFAAEMKKGGAGKAALDFTRRTGNQGYLTAFVESGRVDIAYAEYPFRANENALVFLVNGEPPMIDVDDLSRVDAKKLERKAAYASLKKTYPNLAIFPGDRRPPQAVQEHSQPQGGQRFLVRYELHDGCHACATVGTARIEFEFDAGGRFTRTRIQLRSRGR